MNFKHIKKKFEIGLFSCKEQSEICGSETLLTTPFPHDINFWVWKRSMPVVSSLMPVTRNVLPSVTPEGRFFFGGGGRRVIHNIQTIPTSWKNSQAVGSTTWNFTRFKYFPVSFVMICFWFECSSKITFTQQITISWGHFMNYWWGLCSRNEISREVPEHAYRYIFKIWSPEISLKDSCVHIFLNSQECNCWYVKSTDVYLLVI